jgi:hypothetical protein
MPQRVDLDHRERHLLVVLIAALSAVSAFLAANLARGTARARIVAVLLESLMACFGGLVAYSAATAGAGLQLALSAVNRSVLNVKFGNAPGSDERQPKSLCADKPERALV